MVVTLKALGAKEERFTNRRVVVELRINWMVVPETTTRMLEALPTATPR
jgi:hypothetical protein